MEGASLGNIGNVWILAGEARKALEYYEQVAAHPGGSRPYE
jgi:hypothetical protein